VFLAANEMSDIRADLVDESASIDLDPLAHLVDSASLAEVASDRDSEVLEDVLHGDCEVGVICCFCWRVAEDAIDV